MGKSQESFNKKEKEKKRIKKRKEKLERREQRKLEKEERGPRSFEDMISYVDENGNLTKEKPDPVKMIVDIKLEDIVIGAASRSEADMDPIRIGRVKFFNEEKGYGFIVDKETKESVFVHVNSLAGPIKENDIVSFEVEMGQKGPNAVRVKHHVEKAPPKKVADAKPTAEDAKTPDAKAPEVKASESEAPKGE